MVHMQMEIEEVMKLDGATVQLYPKSLIKEPQPIYACISKPDKLESGVRHVLLLREPNHGFAYLGEIDPHTNVFKFYDNRGQGVSHVEYKDGVICLIYFPEGQKEKLKTILEEQKEEINTIEELLSILQ